MPRMGSHGFSRKDLRQQIGRADREQLKKLRGQVSKLRSSANEAIKQARQACLLAKRPELDEEDRRFSDAVKNLRGERKDRKKLLRGPCYAASLRGMLKGPHELDAIPDYLRPAVGPFREFQDAEHDLTDRRKIAGYEKAADQRQRSRRSAGERLREEDELALREIPEDLHGLWHRLKGTAALRSNRHRTRWEAFLDWVEAHPEEVAEYRTEQQTKIEKQLERELAEEQARRAELAQAELEAEIEEADPQPAPTPGGRAWNFTKLLDKPVQPISNLTGYWSEDLANFAERAALEGKLFMAWRVADLEVLKVEDTIYLCYAGGAVEAIKQGKRTVKGAVEAWLKKTQKRLEAEEKRESQRQQKPPKQPKPPKQTRKGRGGRGRASAPAPARIIHALPPPLRVLALPAHTPEAPSHPLAAARADAESALRALDDVNEDVEVAGTHIEEADGYVLLRFPEKPRAAIRERLKLAGFRWWDPTVSNQHPAWRAPASDRAREVAIAAARAFAESSPAASAYEQRRQERIERMKGRAARERQRGEATYERARELASVIPLGQPIMVGHYSEGRDRRYREKIRGTYNEAFAAMNRADELDRRARAAERNTAISSDDPDAVDKLKAKLQALEDLRAKLPQARKVLKKSTGRNAARKALADLGFGPENIRRLMPDPPLDRWAVSTVQQNTTGEITRLRRRIEELEQRKAAAPRAPEECGDARIYEEDNRVRISFADGKPPKELREQLRGRGFIWAPSVEAWQRKASDGAWYWAREILRHHYGKAPSSGGRASAGPCCSECPDPPPVEQAAAPPESSNAGRHSAEQTDPRIAAWGDPKRNAAAAIALGWLECKVCGFRAPRPTDHNAIGNTRCRVPRWDEPEPNTGERVTKDDIERARRIRFERQIEELNEEGRREGVEVRVKDKLTGIIFSQFPSRATRDELQRRGFRLSPFSGDKVAWSSRDPRAQRFVFDIVRGYISRSPAERMEEAEERDRQRRKELDELEQNARARTQQRGASSSGDASTPEERTRAEIQDLEDLRKLLPRAREILAEAKDMPTARERLRAHGFGAFKSEHVDRLTAGSKPSPKVVGAVHKAISRELASLRRRLGSEEDQAAEERQRAADRAPEGKNRVLLGHDGVYSLLRFEVDPTEELQQDLERHSFVRDGSVREWRMRGPFAYYWTSEILTPRGFLLERDTRDQREGGGLKLEPTSPASRSAAIQAARPATAHARTPSLFGAGGPVPPASSTQQEVAPPTTTPDWNLTSWERTPSLFGTTGLVPPPPGERHVPPQTRLPFK